MVISRTGGKEGDRREGHTLEKGRDRDKKARQMRGEEGYMGAGEWDRYSGRARDKRGRECKQETEPGAPTIAGWLGHQH